MSPSFPKKYFNYVLHCAPVLRLMGQEGQGMVHIREVLV